MESQMEDRTEDTRKEKLTDHPEEGRIDGAFEEGILVGLTVGL